MEMEFKDTGRRRRFILLTTGVALAVVAGWTAFTFASSGTAPTEVITRPVLVAARDVAARTTLTADDLTMRQVSVDDALGQAYDVPGVAIGRVTAVPIYADQQITPSLFATSAANTDFSILGPDEVIAGNSPYWRAVALDVPASRAVGGEIAAGQRVDLFVSVQIDIFALDEEGKYQPVQAADEGGLRSGRSTKIVFQDLEVLKSDPGAGLYILKVTLHQAEQIYHIVQLAPDSFSLALRPGEDSRVAYPGDYGTTTDSLVMEYYFPVPQLIDLTQLLGQPQPTPAPVANPATDQPAPDDEATPEP